MEGGLGTVTTLLFLILSANWEHFHEPLEAIAIPLSEVDQTMIPKPVSLAKAYTST